ncbi:MAG: VanZ family protein [Sediminibacterium sp.]|nr:VanZ family protein [Sediminibacterium sp.]MBX9780596.1 VanZ family protein [Chitinophagaceae bacterium]
MDIIKSFFNKPVGAFFSFILFFSITVYLFTLPKTSLQRFDWITIPHFDKLVHISIFFLLFYLFTHFLSTIIQSKFFTLIISLIFLSAYGIAIEFVQEKFIVGRSFELKDIMADLGGCFLGLLLSLIRDKKIGPDGNRGRNQN